MLICPITGHKLYWWDHDKWVERQKSFTQAFWEDYRAHHKGTNDLIAQEVSQHFKAASKYDRMALNAPTQGCGIIILKDAMTQFFNWIVNNSLFKKVELAALVHDEAVVMFPEEHTEVPNMLKKCMEESAAKYCKKLPIPAEASIGDHWIH